MSKSKIKYQQKLEEIFCQLKFFSFKDLKQIKQIFKKILSYPSTSLAQKHWKSDRLGNYDQIQTNRKLKEDPSQLKKLQRCQCCLLYIQNNQIGWFTTSINEIVNLGKSNRLYFSTLKFSCIFWLLSFLIYGLFSLITNIITSLYDISGISKSKIFSWTIISLSSKQETNKGPGKQYHMIEGWIGLFLVSIWILFFIYKIYRQRIIKIQLDKNQKTASDFSVIIYNLGKQYTKQKIQLQLSKYLNNLKENNRLKTFNLKQNDYEQTFGIYAINYAKPSIDIKQIQKKIKEVQEYKALKLLQQQVQKWLLDYRQNKRFLVQKSQREQIYQKIKALRKKVQRKKVIIQQQSILKSLSISQGKHILFITFKTNFSKISFLKSNQKNFIQKLRSYFRPISQFKFSMDDKIQLKIQQAPQPSDIIWANIGLQQREIIFRKFITYLLAGILLAISFACTYGLSIIQNDTPNIIWSILISITIFLMNQALEKLIQELSLRQRDFRVTYYQINYAIKALLAQLINMILIPIMVNYYIKKNIFEAGGLVSDIMYLSLVNSFIAPLVKCIDPYFLVYRKLRKIYYQQPCNKFKFISQTDFNDKNERYQFEVGLEYVYIIKTFIFTAFFASLQPLILLISSFGLFFMYNAQKYVFLKHCTRPKPSSDLINTALNKILHFTIIAYALGFLTWSKFLPNSKVQTSIIPNIIQIIIGVIFFIIPVEEIIHQFMSESSEQQNNMKLIKYENIRIHLDYEYERQNPVTKQIGEMEFMKYFQNKRRQKGIRSLTHFFYYQNLNQDQPQPLLLKKQQSSISNAAEEYSTEQIKKICNNLERTLSIKSCMSKRKSIDFLNTSMANVNFKNFQSIISDDHKQMQYNCVNSDQQIMKEYDFKQSSKNFKKIQEVQAINSEQKMIEPDFKQSSKNQKKIKQVQTIPIKIQSRQTVNQQIL